MMGLRDFVRAKNPKNCHEAAAVLFYYAREYEDTACGGAKFIGGMFRRAGNLLQAPKHLDQLLRDAMNQYGYLERVARGTYALSKEGEELVLRELPRAPRADGGPGWMDHLHERVVADVGSLCRSGHFANAVVDAVKGLNNRIKAMAGNPSKAGRKASDGKNLIMRVLDTDGGTVKINDCGTESERNIQEGVKFLCAGSWLAWRNPISHDATPALTETEAREMLGCVSLLHRYLDRAESQGA